MDKTTRHNMIRQSAERLSHRRAPMRRPARTSGRWVRLPSHTLTVFDADLEAVKKIVEDAIRERAEDVNVPGAKVHIQLTPKVLRQ